jgi:hypothetical protein
MSTKERVIFWLTFSIALLLALSFSARSSFAGEVSGRVTNRNQEKANQEYNKKNPITITKNTNGDSVINNVCDGYKLRPEFGDLIIECPTRELRIKGLCKKLSHKRDLQGNGTLRCII